MLNQIVKILFFILFTGGSCLCQTHYYGLTAGASSRTDVERVLGKPVRNVSETLVEYAPTTASSVTSSKVYVQYRKDSAIVERIEVLSKVPYSRAAGSEKFHLPPKAPVSRITSEGRFEEYFGAPLYLVLTYAGPNVQSGVAHTGLYSRELFEAAVANIPRNPNNSSPATLAVPPVRSGQDNVSWSPAGDTQVSVNGRWQGDWTNSKGESGRSTVTLVERPLGTITGFENGLPIEAGRRSGNILSWQSHNQAKGCADYVVQWQVSADGKTANGTYRVDDHCANKTYTGKYINYHR